MPTTLAGKREQILSIAAQYGASNLRIFGSTARGDSTDASDVDLLIELGEGRSLLDQIGLQQDLEELLGCHVDVVVEGGISPYLQQQILSEAVPL